MPLNNREKLIVLITNAITAYSKKIEEGTIPVNQSVVDFVLKTIPENLKSETSIELIDDVFYSASH